MGISERKTPEVAHCVSDSRSWIIGILEEKKKREDGGVGKGFSLLAFALIDKRGGLRRVGRHG